MSRRVSPPHNSCCVIERLIKYFAALVHTGHDITTIFSKSDAQNTPECGIQTSGLSSVMPVLIQEPSQPLNRDIKENLPYLFPLAREFGFGHLMFRT